MNYNDYRATKLDYENREKMVKVFSEMRRDGFLARASYECCGGCASSAMYHRAKELTAKGKKVKGAVYWHRQDERGFNESGSLFIGFGGWSETGPAFTMTPEAVAAELIKRFKAVGVKTEWDGSKSHRILVPGELMDE